MGVTGLENCAKNPIFGLCQHSLYSYNYCAAKIEPLFFYLIRVGEYWKMGVG
jgi:hypothetical protein